MFAVPFATVPQQPAPAALSCSYWSRRTGDLETVVDCGDTRQLRIRLAERVWRDVSFNPSGLTEIAQGDTWFYVDRQARAIPVVTLDNGPDPFSEGLTRSFQQNRIIFYNRRLRPVLATSYTWATPFQHGRAEVCTGCVSQPVRPGSEYHMMVGGTWAIIDRTGREVPQRKARPAREHKRP